MKGKPNIILIAMDAVRAQNLSCYGHKRKTTPKIEDNILPQSVLYKNAISSSYWTIPSFTSMFTGTYTSKHGSEVGGDVLSPDLMTMAEILKSKGYFTIGLCKNIHVSSFSGLDRGFDTFYDYRSFDTFYEKLYNKLVLRLRPKKKTAENQKGGKSKKIEGIPYPKSGGILQEFEKTALYKKVFWVLTRSMDRGARAINETVFDLIPKIKGSPFFIFIHYGEAHTPYVIPEPYRQKNLTIEMKNREPWNVNQDPLRHFLNEIRMDELDFDILRALYDGAINYLDEKIYEIYSYLDDEQLLDDTMLILTSDHGDNLGEHGLMFHWWWFSLRELNCGFLYDTLIKVPMIIKYPRDFGLSGKEDKVVQNVDLLPTIMDILEVKAKNLLNQIQGNSLFSENIRRRNSSYGISELTKRSHWITPLSKGSKIESSRHDRIFRICIRSKEKKYILASDGEDEFYDLKEDPNECANLIDSGDPSISEFRKELEPWLRALDETQERGKPQRSKIDEEIKERLRKLGYI